MTVKGLKEALAKKQAQQQQEDKAVVINTMLNTQTAPASARNKPLKKTTGRGR